MLRIEFTAEAIDDLRLFRKFDQQRILDALESQLQYQAADEMRHRKRLRPNRLAEWELRVGPFRVFYDIEPDSTVVKIVAVGYKQGSQLFLHGEEYHL
jgi:mRNA-degrading endonuclease RelE of RelBE toxin-antitoxin system